MTHLLRNVGNITTSVTYTAHSRGNFSFDARELRPTYVTRHGENFSASSVLGLSETEDHSIRTGHYLVSIKVLSTVPLPAPRLGLAVSSSLPNAWSDNLTP